MKIVKDVLGKPSKFGEVGIEIEVEGDNLPRAPKGWISVADGSLRGPSAEYVLEEPVDRRDVFTFLQRLEESYIKNNTRVHQTYRAGVHVHINMLDTSVVHLFNTITLYLIMEDLLVNYCGEDRVGNLFCLRGKDAEYIYHVINKSLQNRTLRHFNTDNIRYASLNLKALAVHGSLEFRAMRGVVNPTEIAEWVSILLKVKDAAERFETPRQIVEAFSANEERLVEEVFQEYAERLQLVDMKSLLTDAVRRVQEYVYTNDWMYWMKEEEPEVVIDIRKIPPIPADMRPNWWYDARNKIKNGDADSWNKAVTFLRRLGYRDEGLHLVKKKQDNPFDFPILEELVARPLERRVVPAFAIVDDLVPIARVEDEDEEGWDDDEEEEDDF